MNKMYKFRVWNKSDKVMIDEPHSMRLVAGVMKSSEDDILMQYIGLEDSTGTSYFIGDIGEFENGDRFVLKMEDWLEVYVEWIGDPCCEDQARDLERIRSAEIIGNIYQNPELLNNK